MPVCWGSSRGAGAEERLHRFLVKVMLLSGTGISVATAVFGAILHWFIPFFYGEAARPTLQLIPWLFVAMSISGFAVGAEAFFLVMDQAPYRHPDQCHLGPDLGGAGVWMIAQSQAVGAAAYIALVHGSAGASVVYIFIHARRPGSRRSPLRRRPARPALPPRISWLAASGAPADAVFFGPRMHEHSPDKTFTSADYDETYFVGHIRRYEEGVYGNRVKWITKYLEGTQGKNLLDAGCGIGFFSEVARRQGARVVVARFPPPALRVYRKRGGADAKLLVGSVEELPFADGRFDFAMAIDVIEHLYHPHTLLAELFRVVRPGGGWSSRPTTNPPGSPAADSAERTIGSRGGPTSGESW